MTMSWLGAMGGQSNADSVSAWNLQDVEAVKVSTIGWRGLRCVCDCEGRDGPVRSSATVALAT